MHRVIAAVTAFANRLGHCARGLLVVTLLWSMAAHAVEANTANEAELDSVRGLGPASTARILAAREAGPFANWADLIQRVKGVKPATAQKLSQQGLTVNGQPFDAGDKAPASPAQ